MLRSYKKLVLPTFIFAVITLVIAGCSNFVPASQQSDLPAKDGRVRSNSEGAVTINVELRDDVKERLAFDVVMDTHSVDLDNYDLKSLAVLRDDQGNEYRPVSWESAPGGHHRSGRLSFPSQSQAQSVELIIRDVANVKQRTFRWQL